MFNLINIHTYIHKYAYIHTYIDYIYFYAYIHTYIDYIYTPLGRINASGIE